jgi:hypothetical protein
MSNNESNRAQEYQKLVQEYEALDEKIDGLLESVGGHTENMTQEQFQTYRQLARERDDIFSQIKAIEAEWFE